MATKTKRRRPAKPKGPKGRVVRHPARRDSPQRRSWWLIAAAVAALGVVAALAVVLTQGDGKDGAT